MEPRDVATLESFKLSLITFFPLNVIVRWMAIAIALVVPKLQHFCLARASCCLTLWNCVGPDNICKKGKKEH